MVCPQTNAGNLQSVRVLICEIGVEPCCACLSVAVRMRLRSDCGEIQKCKGIKTHHHICRHWPRDGSKFAEKSLEFSTDRGVGDGGRRSTLCGSRQGPDVGALGPHTPPLHSTLLSSNAFL